MLVSLNCKVTIEQPGKTLQFTALNHCEIEKSIYILGSKAKIKIPASCRLIVQGRETDSVQTAKQFNRGDKITICLGYNDRPSGRVYRIHIPDQLYHSARDRMRRLRIFIAKSIGKEDLGGYYTEGSS